MHGGMGTLPASGMGTTAGQHQPWPPGTEPQQQRLIPARSEPSGCATPTPQPCAAHLHGGGHKEVLLLEAQLLALVRAVVGVQHRGQRLGALLGQDGLQGVGSGWVGGVG